MFSIQSMKFLSFPNLPTRLLRLALFPFALAPALTFAADASLPVEKKDPTGLFLKMHESFLARGKAGPIGVLFLGDSITFGWTRAPDVWKQYYARYDPANFGIGGDTTENVIWRIEHGEFDGIHPRVVVLMLGTNNVMRNTGEEIAAGDAKIIREIQEKVPGVKVLLLGIFPRGLRTNKDGTIDTGVHAMAVIHDANTRLQKLDNGTTVRYLDIGDIFLGPDGKVRTDLMAEHLHPNHQGYVLWAARMNPLLTQMMAN